MSGPPWWTVPLAPLAWGYGVVMRLRNRGYDRPGVAQRVDRPVISVGNLSVGGVGKSPFVAWLAATLRDEGWAPAIAMRGYGARRGETSDEAAEHARWLPDVPLVVSPDRVGALRAYLADDPPVDVVLLDDGLQHRRLARDLDLVLVDVTRPAHRDRVLPWGRLREPRSGLSRADAVILTRVDGADDPRAHEAAAAVCAITGSAPVAWASHVWTGLDVYDAQTPEGREEPVNWLSGKDVVTVLGVGNRDAVRAQIVAAGARVTRDVPVRNHQRYDAARIESIVTGAPVDAVVTTGKDWVKLGERLDCRDDSARFVVPRLALDLVVGRAALLDLVHSVLPASPRGSRPTHP